MKGHVYNLLCVEEEEEEEEDVIVIQFLKNDQADPSQQGIPCTSCTTGIPNEQEASVICVVT